MADGGWPCRCGELLLLPSLLRSRQFKALIETTGARRRETNAKKADQGHGQAETVDANDPRGPPHAAG